MVFAKPCDEDRGGCGKRFQPTSHSGRVCEKCRAEIRSARKIKRINMKDDKVFAMVLKAFKKKHQTDGLGNECYDQIVREVFEATHNVSRGGK